MIYKGDIILIKDNSLNSIDGKQMQEKKHMFAIMNNRGGYLVGAIISSKNEKVSRRFPYNIPIMDWSKAKLTKASHVKVDRLVRLNFNQVHKKIGHLSDNDYMHIMNAYHKCNIKSLIENKQRR